MENIHSTISAFSELFFWDIILVIAGRSYDVWIVLCQSELHHPCRVSDVHLLLSLLSAFRVLKDVPLSTKRVCLDRDDHSLDKIPIEPLLGVISRGLRIVLMEMMPMDTFINAQVPGPTKCFHSGSSLGLHNTQEL